MNGAARETVRVVARSRPTEGSCDSIALGQEGKTITVRQVTPTVSGQSKTENISFTCDTVLAGSSQERMFDEVGRPLCEAVLQGYNGTALCYGQTGAGKSFTMVSSGATDYHQRGLLPRSIVRIFREVGNRPECEFTTRFSCLEIYNEAMHDLLASLPGTRPGPRAELTISEARGNVTVKGLSTIEVGSEEEALRLLFEAESNRAVAQHALNLHSSRSHVIYTLQVERRSRVDSTGAVVCSALTMVDLAGSERLKKSNHGAEAVKEGSAAARQQAKLAREAMCINKSLSFLEQVVTALGSRSRAHVPHRSQP